MTSGSFSRLFCITALCALLLSVSSPALAVSVTLNTGDAAGTSSYNTAGNWSNAAAPSAGNTYSVATKWLRSPGTSGSFAFGGDSLTLQTGGGLLNKNGGVQTLTQNLILDGGYVRSGSGSADILTLAGTINVASTGALIPDQSPYVVSAAVTGSGTLYLYNNAALFDTLSAATGPGRGIDFTGASTFTGNVVASAADMVWMNTSSWTFNIGATGVNNNIAGTGAATFNGAFNFNLTGASTTPGSSWTITNVTTQTYGTTFSVSTPGFSQSGSVWTNGTYTFNPSTGVLAVAAPPVEWANDADGTWNTGSNWTGGVVPGVGSNALLGTIITANRTVTLDTNVSLNSLTFNNPVNTGDYFIKPQAAQTITLTGEAKVSTTGRHWLQAPLASTIGVNTAGGGELVLDAANTFSGGLNINQGQVSVLNANAIPAGNAVSIAAGATMLLSGGEWFVDNGMVSTGLNGVTFSNAISGGGNVNVAGGAEITIATANTYTGLTNIYGLSTLTLSGSGTLGASDGLAATRTTIQDESQLVLNGVAVGTEYIVLDENYDGEPAKIVTTGTSSIAGNINAGTGDVGSHYEIKADSGTLTLSGVLSAYDAAAPNDRIYVFSGAGNTNVTGKITDSAVDANGVPTSTSAGDNVHVIKRGTGKLTISTATANGFDYWAASTTIEAGTLEVISDGADQGELWSSSIDVQAAGTFDVHSFTEYSLQEAQALGGSGHVVANTLAVYDDNIINPGSSVGTLTINGNVTLNPGGATGSLNYELGNTTTIGGTENDLIQINGSLTNLVITYMTLNVRPVEGSLAAGTYRLINHTGGTTDVSAIAPRIVDGSGNVLDTRQTVALSGATAGQVNLIVTGSAANLTWAGTTNGTWDATNPSGGSTLGTANWSGSATKFAQLDTVTFGNAGSNKNITVAEAVAPGTMTVTGSSANYTFTGSKIDTTSVTVSSGATASFANTVAGSVTVQSTATLAGTGTFQGNVTAQSGGKIRVGGAGLVPQMAFAYLDANHTTNTTLSDGSALVPATGIWELRTGIGGNSDSIYMATQDTTAGAPEIKTTITGLTPNTSYTLYVDFWDATGSSWRVLAGSTSGALTLFANPDDNVAGATGAVTTASLPHLSALSTASGNRTLYSGLLGTLTSDGSGNLVVYVDDSGTADGDDRTFYDGLSYNSGTTIMGTGKTMNVQGDLSLLAGSKVTFDIAMSGTNDKLAVTGNLGVADGVVLEVLLDGSIPASSLVAGNSWDLFDFGTTSGVLNATDFILPTGLSTGLAWDTTTLLTTGVLSVVSAVIPGDFDADGDVDGADFLVWQRNPGIGSLTDWQTNYGAPLVAASTAATAAVPEPTAALLLALGMCGWVCRRQSGRQA